MEPPSEIESDYLPNLIYAFLMALSFDKQQLSNLEYSLQREMLATNRAGGYMSTTIVCCNTRKYHGLMVCPVRELGDNEFVLLSSLDETIIQHDQSFNLALHRFRGSYEPKGHKYLTDFAYTPTPTFTYRVGGVVLQKELLWVHSAEQLLVRYTLLNATSQTFLRLRPFLAFRNRHELSRANLTADTKSYNIRGGVRNKLYDKLPSLFMQTSMPAKHIAAPDWYYGFEYACEEQRGEAAHEDLLTTGYFELELKAGESVIFSASTSEIDPDQLESLYQEEIERRSDKVDFLSALRHSARQFLILYQGSTMLQAGYPWYNPRSRETFIALAGCTLTQGLTDRCTEILQYHKSRLNNGIFGTHIGADTQLWFFHTLSEYEREVGAEAVWSEYSGAMKEILTAYRDGTTPKGCIRMEANSLIYAYRQLTPMTWMKAQINGYPVTLRPGFAVEVNALWYNAICYALELAHKAGDREFIAEWELMPERIKESFVEVFWSEEHRYLADYVKDGYKNFEVRPNQLLALSLKFSPLDDIYKGDVLQTVKGHLLTPRGIRTLSPQNPNYKGHYVGTQAKRAEAEYQGSVVPWLLEHYVRAAFATVGKSFVVDAQDILNNFMEDTTLYGIGSVSELYDGDPPHSPAGAISFAPSVGAILQIERLIEENL